MHLGCSIGRPWEGRASHPVLDGVGPYSGGIIVGEAAVCFGKTSCSMMALPSGGEDGMQARRAGSVARLSGRLVWTRGTIA